MSPRPQVSSIRELASRWGVSRQTVNAVVASRGFPEPTELGIGRVWSEDDIAAWEAAERVAGRALPGQTGYGPAPGTPAPPRRRRSREPSHED